MRIGAGMPSMGPETSPEGIVKAAQLAEELEYDAVWVAERLLFPLEPRSPYPSPDGVLPDFYRYTFTPIETLTFIAAHTKRIGLGTSVLNMPMHNPVHVARQLTTLDVLSGGRVRVGLGQGWSEDEMIASNAPKSGRAARADEFIAVLKAVWGDDPVEFKGEYFEVPRSILQPKPLTKPRPPIYLAAYAPSALERAARLADGWLPTGIPLDGVKAMSEQLRQAAKAAGRDPSKLEVLVLGHVTLTDEPQGEGRPNFVGNIDEIRQDIAATRDLGASELILNPGATPRGLTNAGFQDMLKELRELV